MFGGIGVMSLIVLIIIFCVAIASPPNEKRNIKAAVIALVGTILIIIIAAIAGDAINWILFHSGR